MAGFVGAPSTQSVVSVVSAPSCAVLRRLAPSCAALYSLAPPCAALRRLAPSAPSWEMVRDGANGERSETTALYDRNISLQPATNIPSLYR